VVLVVQQGKNIFLRNNIRNLILVMVVQRVFCEIEDEVLDRYLSSSDYKARLFLGLISFVTRVIRKFLFI